jgi:hypothetical protein
MSERQKMEPQPVLKGSYMCVGDAKYNTQDQVWWQSPDGTSWPSLREYSNTPVTLEEVDGVWYRVPA